MKALVTGATGYIGHNLTARLAHDGAEVHVVLRPTSDTSRLANLVPAPAIHILDGSTEGIVDLFRGIKPDAVFHLATVARQEHSPAEVLPIVTANVAFGCQVLEGMARCGTTRLINAGSYWVYNGEGNYAPNTLYAATKRAFGALLPYYAKFFGLLAVTLVLYDVYGPNDWRGKLIAQYKQWLVEGKGRLAMTAGTQSLDMVHVDDVVDGLLRAEEWLKEAERSPGSYEFLLGSGRLLTVREVVDAISRILGRPVEVEWGALPPPPGQINVPYEGGERLPGWSPRWSLEKGLRDVFRDEAVGH